MGDRPIQGTMAEAAPTDRAPQGIVTIREQTVTVTVAGGAGAAGRSFATAAIAVTAAIEIGIGNAAQDCRASTTPEGTDRRSPADTTPRSV